eukprot:SAG22_NODE_73_length_22318_cov_47.105315_12_plen_161_part_00
MCAIGPALQHSLGGQHRRTPAGRTSGRADGRRDGGGVVVAEHAMAARTLRLAFKPLAVLGEDLVQPLPLPGAVGVHLGHLDAGQELRAVHLDGLVAVVRLEPAVPPRHLRFLRAGAGPSTVCERAVQDSCESGGRIQGAAPPPPHPWRPPPPTWADILAP